MPRGKRKKYRSEWGGINDPRVILGQTADELRERALDELSCDHQLADALNGLALPVALSLLQGNGGAASWLIGESSEGQYGGEEDNMPPEGCDDADVAHLLDRERDD